MPDSPSAEITKFCRTAWAPAGEEAPSLFMPSDSSLLSWSKAKIAALGVPLDITTSFGHATKHGPYAIRQPSAFRIESLVTKYGIDIGKHCPVFDLGDFNTPETPKDAIPTEVDKWLDSSMAPLRNLIDCIIKAGKIPLILGGEHGATYYTLSALAMRELNPVVLHFDAHLDAKESYMGMRRSHTAPMYWLMKGGHVAGKDFLQIGPRQWDAEERKHVDGFGATVFEGHKFADDGNGKYVESVCEQIASKTKGRNIAITFDIDAYDSSLLRCTGTPEPFGLSFPQVVRIFESVHKSAKLIYLDMMEVGYDPRADPSFIEGGLAAQTILHALAQPFARNKA